MTDAAVERYRQAERAFWDHYGLAPIERFVEVGSPPARLRVQELGSGAPVLFVNGTGGPGAYFAPLLGELHGFRCLVFDRPGWGPELPDGLLRGAVRDGHRRAAAPDPGRARHRPGPCRRRLDRQPLGAPAGPDPPSRVERLVLLGAGPLTCEIGVPPFIRLLRSPLSGIVARIPETPRLLAKQLTGLGHGASLNAGRIPDAFIEWHVAMSRETAWARNERAMVRSIVDRRGFVPGLVLRDAEIAGIEQPTLMVYGTADPIGSLDHWRNFVHLLPRGELEVADGGGHLVWYDQPGRIGARVARFLAS